MNKINDMSFNELKNELHNCGDNKIKEKLIRELMMIKYQQYINQHKNVNRTIKIPKKKKIKTNKIPKNEVIFSDSDFNDDEINNNKIIEYGKDITNNNLMDRLNNDVEIKTMKVSTSKKDIVKPFVNSNCDTYATFKNEPGTDIKNFKN
jgi:hypothetical protein